MPRLSRRTWTALFGLAGIVVLLIAVGQLPSSGSGGAVDAGPAATSTPPSSAAASRAAGAPASPARSDGLPPGVPSKVLAVLRVVEATGGPPQGYVGGRRFFNDGRGGTTALPREDAAGDPVGYREYDVNPRRQGVNRGLQRLVVGDDGSAWYTPDHYQTWVRIR